MSKNQPPVNSVSEQPVLVLASGSRFRQSLLQRLTLEFDYFSPDIDESPLTDEPCETLSERLAITKARSGLSRYGASPALLIGSDQVASLTGKPLGKPGNHENALHQLRQSSGREVTFYTALCLLDTRDDTVQTCVDICVVRFRQLTDAQIERYLSVEKPYDCAGSIKSEALGISLLESMNTSDPTGLIGLPLISLVRMLHKRGFLVP